MMMTTTRAAVLAAPILLAAGLANADDNWLTDMDNAMEVAANENKVILMDFTGSDWCGWCIKLKEEVFSQSMFQEYAREKLVLVELDFPSQKQLSEEQVAHNEKWRDKVGIQGYPTIVLADEQGEEFARTGYQPGGPSNYVDHLTGLLNGKEIRDAALTAAGKVDGIARAKMLDWALSIEGVTVPNAEALMEEIVALDADNVAGLRKAWTLKLNDSRADKKFMEIQQSAASPEDALAGVDEILANYELSPEKYGEMVGVRVSMLAQTGKIEEAKTAIDEFLARDDVDAEAKQQVAASAINLHIMQQELDEAVAAFERAIELAPGSEFGKMLSGQRDDFMNYVNNMRDGG